MSFNGFQPAAPCLDRIEPVQGVESGVLAQHAEDVRHSQCEPVIGEARLKTKSGISKSGTCRF